MDTHLCDRYCLSTLPHIHIHNHPVYQYSYHGNRVY